MNVTQAAQQYIEARSRRGELRPKAADTIRWTLLPFARFIGNPLLTEVSRSHVACWLEERPVAVSTRRSQLSIVRTFFRWAILEGHATLNPADGFERIRQPRYVPRAIRSHDVAQLIAAVPDARGLVIVLLMVQEGLRCVEVAGLELGDIDWTQRLILVRGKGGHERVLPLSTETIDAIEHYLAEAPANAGPLVRSYTDPREGVSSGYVSDMLRRWMRAAGLKRAAFDGRSAHALRHTAATDMLRAGAHVRDVQAALGHQSLATTERYLAWHVEGLRKAMGGRSYGESPPGPARFVTVA